MLGKSWNFYLPFFFPKKPPLFYIRISFQSIAGLGNNYGYYVCGHFFLKVLEYYTKINHYIEANTNTLHVLLLGNFCHYCC